MNIIRIVIGAGVGGGLGYACYRRVGCATGACPLMSNPWISTIYGMCIGGLIAGAVH